MIRRRRRNWKKVFTVPPKTPSECLYTPNNTIEFSAYAQNSLTSLDLSRHELSKFKSKVKLEKIQGKRKLNPNCEIFPDKFFRDTYIGTEEDCRKRLAINRYVLYKYHLDVSKRLEFSLRYAKKRELSPCYSDNVLLNRVCVAEINGEDNYLIGIIQSALDKFPHKIKLISNLCKLSNRFKYLSKNDHIRNKSVTFLCFQRPDPGLVRDFLNVMEFDAEVLFNYSIDIFEFVLDHAHRIGFDLWGPQPYHDPIHLSVSYRMFVKTETLFLYYSAPNFCPKMYEYFLDAKRGSLPIIGFKRPEENGLLTKERHLLIIELLHIYWRDKNYGLKPLQMIWRSVAEPLVTLDEVEFTLSTMPNSDTVTKFCGFLKQVTGEDVSEESGLSPRQLKHYCRIKIRNVLSSNGKLSSLSSELKLPPSLKSYLNLAC